MTEADRSLSTRLAGEGVVIALGLVGIGINVLHSTSENENVWTFLFGIAFPTLLAASLVAGGVWLARNERLRPQAPLVSSWTLVGLAVLLVAGVFVVFYQRAEHVTMTDPEYVVANMGAFGAVTGLIVGTHDAERRLTRNELATSRGRAEELAQRVSVLNRILRHDIRNAVTTIRGYASNLESVDGAGADARVIEEHATRLYDLGERAQAMERTLQRGDVARTDLDLAAVAAASVARVRDAHPAHRVDVALPSSLGVTANPLLDSAVENLVENAVVHNHRDPADVRVAVTVEAADRDGRPGGCVRIADNGPGVPDREVAVLDQAVETELAHSRGLGLWTAHWIATDSGGDLSFAETDPTGTVVTLWVPA